MFYRKLWTFFIDSAFQKVWWCEFSLTFIADLRRSVVIALPSIFWTSWSQTSSLKCFVNSFKKGSTARSLLRLSIILDNKKCEIKTDMFRLVLTSVTYPKPMKLKFATFVHCNFPFGIIQLPKSIGLFSKHKKHKLIIHTCYCMYLRYVSLTKLFHLWQFSLICVWRNT